MTKIHLMLALAGATFIAGAPALAQHGNGHGNGNGNGHGGGFGGSLGGILNGSGDGRDAEIDGRGRIDSQGAAHANARAIERSNAHSALHSQASADIDARNHGQTRRALARANSRAKAHANARALARANANSAISTDTTVTTRYRGTKRHGG